MILPPDLVEAIKQKIIASKKTLLLAHKNPDGDTMGSALAMFHYLKGLAKEVEVGCFNAAADGLQFLPGIQNVIHTFDEQQYDLIMSFDSADPKLSGLEKSHSAIFERKDWHINIDHHVSNLKYAGINLVISECASTTQVLYYLFKEFKAILTRDIATCLLTGLYTDTGSFMHQNTTAETLRVGAGLLAHGADVTSIARQFFQRKPVHQLKLWGLILDRAKITPENIIVSAVTKADLQSLGADKDDISGAIEFLKYVPEIRYAEILSEEEEGKVKGSLRTIRDDVNVSAIASGFGGGGHVKAAGFTIPNARLGGEYQWRVTGDQGEKVF